MQLVPLGRGVIDMTPPTAAAAALVATLTRSPRRIQLGVHLCAPGQFCSQLPTVLFEYIPHILQILYYSHAYFHYSILYDYVRTRIIHPSTAEDLPNAPAEM